VTDAEGIAGEVKVRVQGDGQGVLSTTSANHGRGDAADWCLTDFDWRGGGEGGEESESDGRGHAEGVHLGKPVGI